MMATTIALKIKRRDDSNAEFYWEEFELPYRSHMNIISCLMEIQRRPVNAKGEKTTPIVWDDSCLEEVCGSCTMVINGRVRQACSALIDRLSQPITIEPMSKFPTIRDLRVDRSVMFENLKRVKAWVPIDGTHNLGPGPRMNPADQQIAYELSRCMTCGCCLEACPQFNDKTDFIGAAAISQVRLFNMHPTGKLNADERVDAIVGEGGLEDCGNAQICVEVCPKNIPLTTSIATMEWEATKRIAKKLLGS
ncbi:MAG: succinate dehydrogenase iron-sulfur subunit [Deltaproteobacteria bacterium]|nr:succinate dehydrogenase iron-sulfur subunit [Deltaproteobacteria bacterium]